MLLLHLHFVAPRNSSPPAFDRDGNHVNPNPPIDDTGGAGQAGGGHSHTGGGGGGAEAVEKPGVSQFSPLHNPSEGPYKTPTGFKPMPDTNAPYKTPTGFKPMPEMGDGAYKAKSGQKEKYPRMGEIKAAMKNQLIREGVPADRAEMGANVLVGQAIAESGLKSQYHDTGKRLGAAGGYVPSIYGADLKRGKGMTAWIKSKGGDPNDTVWQGRYMSHEWMTKFPKLKKAMLDPNVDMRQLSKLGTTDYEAPASRHSPHTQQERYNNAKLAERVQLDQEKTKASKIPNADAENTKGLVGGQTSDGLLGAESINKFKIFENITKAAEGMERKAEKIEKDDSDKEAMNTDNNLKQNKMEFVDSTNKTGYGTYDVDPFANKADLMPAPKKFTDELIEKKLQEEGGWRRKLGWDYGPQGRNRRKQLSVDPWNTEPGWDPPAIKEPPRELPEPPPDPVSSEDKFTSSSLDDSIDKSEGSRSKITEPNAAKKPSKIRPVDIPKYYPQYKGNDFGAPQTGVGIGVA
jgi:hypothetical protein